MDGATDVTARYVRHSKHANPRDRCSEEELAHILAEVTSLRREKQDEATRARLESESRYEARELLRYVVKELVRSLCSDVAQGRTHEPNSTEPDADKLLSARLSTNGGGKR